MSDYQATGQTLAGGVARVSFGPQSPTTSEAVAVGPTTRVVNGAARVIGRGEVEQHGGTVRHTVSHDGHEGGSVLATLARAGMTQSVELIPGQPSSRTSVAVALREGVLVRLHDGRLADARTAAGAQRTLATNEAEKQAHAEQQAAATAQQEAADLAGVFNAEEDAQWRTEMGAIPEHAFATATARIVKAVTLGESFDAAAAALSRDTGMSPDEALRVVETGYNLQNQIVTRAVQKVGVTDELMPGFFEHALKEPGRLQHAMNALMHTRDVRPFMDLGREYAAKAGRLGSQAAGRGAAPSKAEAAGVRNAAPRTPESLNPALLQRTLEKAGFETWTDNDGNLSVIVAPGQYVPAADFMRGKLA